VAVDAFRAGDLGFTGIVDTIDAVLAAHAPVVGDDFTLAAVSAADGWARSEARTRIATGVH
jgi:1-deoxy-D-xylulose-5-phosphate reductoisomerase